MRERRTKFEASIDKRRAVKQADADGLVADSLEVRKALMQRVYDGTSTLEEVQAELRKIIRNAKKLGLKTRSQVFNES